MALVSARYPQADLLQENRLSAWPYRVYGLYRLFQSRDSSWARVSWRCSHAWWSGMCSSQKVFPQYSHCLFCFVSLPHLSHFVIFVRSRWVSIIFWFKPVRRSFSESCCCPIRGSTVAGSWPADFPSSVETFGPVHNRAPLQSTPLTVLVSVDRWRCSSGRSSSQSRSGAALPRWRGRSVS